MLSTTRRFKLIALQLLVCSCTFSFAQNNTQTTEEKPKKSLLKKVWGVAPNTSITAMPYGLHTDLKRFRNRKYKNGLHPALYGAFNYKTVEAIAFRNSFGDFSFGVTYKRAIPITKNFTILYGIGAMYGYDGRLQRSKNVPLRNTFLIKGDINPLLGVQLDYKLYKGISLHTGLAPGIIIYGFRYSFQKFLQ